MATFIMRIPRNLTQSRRKMLSLIDHKKATAGAKFVVGFLMIFSTKQIAPQKTALSVILRYKISVSHKKKQNAQNAASKIANRFPVA